MGNLMFLGVPQVSSNKRKQSLVMNSGADILIIGGGAIGLATAIALTLRGATVTVLNRNFQEAAVHAAAGMLAPQAEGIPAGPMLDLCLRSRALYPEWTQKLELLTGMDTGYWPCGILAPQYSQPSVLPSPPPVPEGVIPSQWLDHATIHLQQPSLGREVLGGWWYPEDAQVDNQALSQVLLTAAQQLGVNLQDGVTVTAVERQGDRVLKIKTTAGDWQAQTYILAAGAWSQDLLPIPVLPRKGQMLSVRTHSSEADSVQPLRHVLFGPDIYIVPRRNGRIVLGATSEDVGFATYNTPAGVQSLLAAAMRLYPPIHNFVMEEPWWGFRPTTPDELPILGSSPYENLVLATGHYRNGILLAPITADLITDWVIEHRMDPLLAQFSYQRFAALETEHSVPLVPVSRHSRCY